MSEKTLQRAVCDYIRYRYPGVMFNSDLAGATKLTPGQAIAMSNLRDHRVYPDLAIFEPRNGHYGLFIELKKEGEKIYTRAETLVADPHIREQEECLRKLRSRGYRAEFAVGFDQARAIIDDYLTI